MKQHSDFILSRNLKYNMKLSGIENYGGVTCAWTAEILLDEELLE